MARLKEDEIIPPGSKWEKEDPWPGHPAVQRCHSLWRGHGGMGFGKALSVSTFRGTSGEMSGGLLYIWSSRSDWRLWLGRWPQWD